MPCVSLKHRKKYKATVMSAAQAQSVKSGKVVASEDVNKMSAEAARLVSAAKTPEYFEVALTDTTDGFLKTAITSARVKLPRQSLARRLEMAILQPLLLKSLRHRVLKAARANTASQPQQAQQPKQPKQSQNLSPLSSLQNQPMPMPEGVDIPLRKPRRTVQTVQTVQSTYEVSQENQKTPRDVMKNTAKTTKTTELDSASTNSAKAAVKTTKAAKKRTQSKAQKSQKPQKSQKIAKRAQKAAVREAKIAQKNTIKTAKLAQKSTLKATKLTQKTAKKSAKLARKQRRQAVDELMPTRILHRRPSRAELINAESRLGSTIFGPVPAGHRREFFHDQANVWIWHEAWDDGHASHQITVRYEVRPAGVFKKVSMGKYTQLVDEELENFRRATHVYLHLIKQKLYQIQPVM